MIDAAFRVFVLPAAMKDMKRFIALRDSPAPY